MKILYPGVCTRWWMAVIVSLAVGVVGARAGEPLRSSTSSSNDWSDLSLEQLVNVEVVSAATLTRVDSRRVPVDVTELDARDITQSGARNLDQLLEDYVPNEQYILHHTPQPDLGFRGIISDVDNVYLYRVNGVTLNNRMVLGAANERDLPLLGDIHSVTVVRGPASATDGAGALAGVIDVETYTGLTFTGMDVNVRQGFFDQYTAAEARYGLKLSDTSGLFMYFGGAQIQGAPDTYYIGHPYTAINGLPPNVPGEPNPGPISSLNAPAFGEPWYKAHVDYVNGPWEFWGRFVQDGGLAPPTRTIYTKSLPAGESLEEFVTGREILNDQYTVAGRFKKDLSPTWNLELLQSDDLWAFKDQRAGTDSFPPRPTRLANENQAFSRAIARWTPADFQSLAFGVEYAHVWYHDPAYSDALDASPVISDRDWQADTISLLAEDQWRIGDYWTTFLSIRTDKDTFTPWMVSPRATVVFTPTANDTFKAIAGQAVRSAVEEQLWAQWERDHTVPDPETLRSCELSYDRKLTEDLHASIDTFYEDWHAVGYSQTAGAQVSLGDFQIMGGEFVLSFTNHATRVTLSEGATKLLDASVPSNLGAAGQGITSEPYGYGNDLAEWAPFVTKFAALHDVGKKWTLSSSVVYYSGFPGAQAYADYNRSLSKPSSGAPLSNPNYTTPYGPNLYINLGVEFRPSNNWTFRLDGYNLAALADPTLSKRNYYFRLSEFSVEPASMTVSARYRF
ncbi:MAG TPA: TonB-dependent receptor plug domain-containing protein [Verrucomicrobiae bacterium]|nr:TonB-dependent receptor plug domain-containing protein [Verrucomicrobiae bacterium]